MDKICGNCGAWESDRSGKGWIGYCPFDQYLYSFTKKCESDKWVPKYDDKVIKWCRKYAEDGNANAQYSLGMIFEQKELVTENLELAHMWFSLASGNGHADAVKKIQELESKMTLSEIEKAKDLARNRKSLE